MREASPGILSYFSVNEASQLGGVLDFMKNIMFSQVVNSQTSVRVIFVNSCPLVSEYLNSEYDFQTHLEDFRV